MNKNKSNYTSALNDTIYPLTQLFNEKLKKSSFKVVVVFQALMIKDNNKNKGITESRQVQNNFDNQLKNKDKLILQMSQSK